MKYKRVITHILVYSMLIGIFGGVFVKAEVTDTVKDGHLFKYSAIENGMEITNGNNINDKLFYNRPLFGGSHVNDTGDVNKHIFVYAADRPSFSYIKKTKLANVFFGIKGLKWLHEMDNITARYVSGYEEYEITDSGFDGTIYVTFVRASEFDGLLVKITVPDELKEKLVVAAGGTSAGGSDYNSAILSNMNFVPANCSGTTIDSDNYSFSIVKTASDLSEFCGFSSVGMSFKNSNALMFTSGIDKILESTADNAGMITGVSEGNSSNDIYFNFTTENKNDPKIETYLDDPVLSFDNSVNYVTALSETVQIDTPDKYLDSALTTQILSLDGAYDSPYITHGGTRWHQPFSGWRAAYAFSVLDWRNAVKENAIEYINLQQQQFEGIEGRIPAVPTQSSNNRYNMGEVFVDQLLYYYEQTNDIDFMRDYAYKSIKDHISYMDTYFKVQGTNLYENFLNAWNTDNKWANGGASTIATAYMWRACTAMTKLAATLGYSEDSAYFSEKSRSIESEFRDQLWSKNKGVFAEYKDYFGNQMLHDSPDLSSIYTPIDMGFADEFEAYQSLKFSENYIERYPALNGGELVNSSNWLPEFYSTNGIFTGELANLMLSYYQNGQGDKADKILRGLETILFQNHGEMSNVTDESFGASGNLAFPDTVSVFIKGITDGLFGITVDTPENKVTVKPAFPKHWDHASIKTPNLEYSYQFSGSSETITVTNSKGFDMDFRIPAKSMSVSSVKVNGSDVEFVIEPSVENMYIRFSVAADINTEIEINYSDSDMPSLEYDNTVGYDSSIKVTPSAGVITEIKDMQNIVKDFDLKDGCTIEFNNKDGFHTVFAKVEKDGNSVWIPIDFEIIKPEDKISSVNIEDLFAYEVNLDEYVNQTLSKLHTNTYTLDYNGQTDYILPRFPWSRDSLRTVMPNGRSWWEKQGKNSEPFSVDTSTLPEQGGLYNSSIGIPFKISNINDKNTVFTSIYNNFPNKVTIPVNKTGQKIYFMLAFSTNNMQSRIENARITVNFSDGTNKILSISNPENIDDWLSYGTGSSYALSGTIERLGSDAHANILCLDFGEEKEIESFDFECMANEVLAGLLGATVYSFGDADMLEKADSLITAAEKNDLSEFYDMSKLQVMKDKKASLEKLLLGSYSDEQIVESVHALSSSIDDYMNSSTVTLSFTPEEDIILPETQISISSNNSDIVIRYTTDGSEPTKDSSVFTESFNPISSITTIKAAPFYNDVCVGSSVSKTYTFADVNLAEGKEVTASNVHSSPYPGENAIDGNVSTRWATRSGFDNVSLIIDFGGEIKFNKVVLNEAMYDDKSRIGSIAVQFLASDGVSWRTAYFSNGDEELTITGDEDPKQGERSLSFPAVKSSSVRILLGTNPPDKAGPSLWECGIYNDVSNKDEAGVSIGDYFRIGSYNGEAIIWRVVDIDENGPLLISDKALCMKSFDVAGDDIRGSHGRTPERLEKGSDYWYDSNIRSWLISSAEAGEVEWLCGNAPTAESVGEKNGVPYADEAGFLCSKNFNSNELELIKEVRLKSIVNGTADISGSEGSTIYARPNSWDTFMKNYDTAIAQYHTETIFLPDVAQAYDIYSKSLIFGNDYVLGTLRDTGEKVFT